MNAARKKKVDDILSEIYYNLDHPGGYSGLNKLIKHSKLKRQTVKTWLNKQLTYNLHKSIRKNFPRRKYTVRGIDFQWQVDLADIPKFVNHNKGYRYILTVIDVFSRYAFARGLKSKHGKGVSNALEDIFILSNRKPKYIQCDQGKEFYNIHVKSLLKRYDIELFSVFSDVKCALVERFNRTLKDKMYKYFTYNGTYNWIDVLSKLISSYNSSIHSTINIAPKDVGKSNETNIWLYQYKDLKKGIRQKYNIGDKVRISKYRKVFDRGFTTNWTNESFEIYAVNNKYSPIMYTLKDYYGEILKGKFYDYELQLIENPDDIYVIEKILNIKGKGKNKQAFVKWLGYKDPSWISYDSIGPLKKM